MTARTLIECRRRAVEDSLSGRGWLSITAEPETYQPAVPDGKTRDPMRFAETRCTLGYVIAGGDAAEAEDHAGVVG
jgi:hypothetical protein